MALSATSLQDGNDSRYGEAKECASSALRIQAGESPAPVKPSKQPVHSLEAKAAR